jgi:hypothetical protein
MNKYSPNITMDNIYKRYLLFLVGCMGARLALVLLARNLPLNWLRIMGFVTLIPGLGFLWIYFTNSRKTGREVFGEKIWWNSLRPLHGLLYLAFSYLAITKERSAWEVLALDVVIGLIAFLHKHFT